MRPPNDEELILYYYGDSREPEVVEEALAASPDVARRYESIRRLLDAVPKREPAPRSELYGRRVWRRISPGLIRDDFSVTRSEEAIVSGRTVGKIAGWAVAATLLLVLAFWAGRESVPPAQSTSAFSDAARQRILRSTVVEHLERSRFLLEEIANEGVEASDAALSRRVRQLTADNRLYRQAARRQADPELVVVLEELERFLTELAHLEPSAGTGNRPLEARLEETGLLFKIRVLITMLERDTTAPAPPTTTT